MANGINIDIITPDIIYAFKLINNIGRANKNEVVKSVNNSFQSI